MYARRTESIDAIELEKMITPEILRLFGKENLIYVIEKALLSVTLVENNAIIGFGAFYDYPKTQNYKMSENWNEIYDLKEHNQANAMNSLFLHYFISVEKREVAALVEMVNTVFITSPDIHYVFINTESGVLPLIFGDLFKKMNGVSNDGNWFVLLRQNYMPRLYIRPARQEDNDELTPIFNAQSAVLEKIYGEFYISEMVQAQNDDMKCFVADVEDKAIGFISVNKEANLDVLNFGFHLEPFQGFKKEDKSETDTKVSQTATTDEVTEVEEKHEEAKEEYSVPVAITDISEHDYTTESANQVTENTVKFQVSESTSFETDAINFNIDPKCIPTFTGFSNAMIIQLFAINELYEMRSVDFLNAVFEAFPTRDYLLITIPYSVPEFPLLEYFVRVTPRIGAIIPHELYCVHRSTIGAANQFAVRPMVQSDTEIVTNLISNMNFNRTILADLDEYHQSRRYSDPYNTQGLQAFIAECSRIIIGVALLVHEEHIDYVRSHWNIEDFIYFTHHKREEHGRLKHFALNPIFKRLSKPFIKEIMRKANKSTLYFPLYKRYVDKSSDTTPIREKYSLVTNMQDLVPVRPRRQIQYDLKKLEINAPTERILHPPVGGGGFHKDEDCCLTHINRKLIMEPKIAINARIVVVGASCTGLSFLDYLTFCPHLRFNNLFLVSPNGFGDEHPDDPFIEQLMGNDLYFSKKKLEQSSLRMQVNVVKGYMTAIDRKKKHIKVNEHFILSYDHLIITTGLQFTLPFPTGAQIEKKPTTQEVNISSDRRYSEIMFKAKEKRLVPENFFTVNDATAAFKTLEFVRNILLKENDYGAVIIYGHCFETYCCLHTLLAMGVRGNRIHFVNPPTKDEVRPLNNTEVEDAVYATLQEAGVHIYYNYSLAQFNASNDVPFWITNASFTTHGPPARIDCKMFISYYKKVVNYDAFKACNDACLVFDARLVIDTFFHTNDLSIRAAGPFTKFKRRYYRDQWNHSRFNSKVVGEELSKVFLRLFDPTLEPLVTPPTEEVPLIPMYFNAVINSAKLPGGYNYLHVAKPGLPISLGEQMTQTNYGTVIATGSPRSEEGYFRLHLNQYQKVETITCLSRNDFPTNNFIQLYGIHERALNNLLTRHKSNLVTNLYSYFTDNWTNAFYHDRFPDLREEIKELLVTNPSTDVASFDEMVRKMTYDGNQITPNERKKLLDNFRQNGAIKTVDQRLLSFIAYNYYHLPMYAKPDIV